MAASELLDLISKEMHKNRSQRSDSTPEPAPSKPTPLRPKPDPEKLDSSLARHKASAVPIVVCRKRSSITSAKASNNNSEEKQKNNQKPTTSKGVNEEEQSPARVKTKERIVTVTGTRSLRKSTKSGVNSATNKNHQMITKENDASSAGHQKGEAQKTDKKKTEVAVKKQGAADFLKRIKRNSPLKETPSKSKSSKRSDANGGGKNEQKKRGDRQKDTSASKQNGGGLRQKSKLESSPSKRSVGRPAKKGREAAAAAGGGRKRGRAGEVGSKQEKKRARR